MDIGRHRDEIRRLVAEAPDEPTHCEFKLALSYDTKKEKGELVKDVSSFANADLEALGGHGYIVFGVSDGGQVVGIVDGPGDPSSGARQVVNGHLGRPIAFEYLTCEVDDKAGGTKRVACIVIPDSRRRPHVASKEIKERLGNKDKFWLREGEVWVRKTGGRELATADDIDEMYEGKLRRLVEERVRPLQGRIERVEQDVQEQKNAAPQLSFGAAVPGSAEVSPEGTPYSVLDNLIGVAKIDQQIREARQHAVELRASLGPYGTTFGPSPDSYERYGRQLEEWFRELEDLLVVDFVLLNTGRALAEDVQVILEVPPELRPREGLPEKPSEPRGFRSPGVSPGLMRAVLTKQTSPDSLIGPDIVRGTSGTTKVLWEVGKLYHDRPLSTASDADEAGGLLISGKHYREHMSRAGDEVRLEYALRAANVPNTVRGALLLR